MVMELGESSLFANLAVEQKLAEFPEFPGKAVFVDTSLFTSLISFLCLPQHKTLTCRGEIVD